MAGMGTELTISQMRKVSENLSEQIRNYNTAVTKLYEIGEEIDAMWDGEASQKFMANLGNDRERFNALTNMLSKYVEALNQDINTYIQAENESIQIINTNRK